MAGDGYRVRVEELRIYSDKLQGDIQTADEIKNLVAQADVGDQSWGVVGLFVKQNYTGMLTGLHDLLLEMGSGLKSASAKIAGCANVYQQLDDGTKAAFENIANELDATTMP